MQKTLLLAYELEGRTLYYCKENKKFVANQSEAHGFSLPQVANDDLFLEAQKSILREMIPENSEVYIISQAS